MRGVIRNDAELLEEVEERTLLEGCLNAQELEALGGGSNPSAHASRLIKDSRCVDP